MGMGNSRGIYTTDAEQNPHHTLVAGALVSAGLRSRGVLQDRDQRLASGAPASMIGPTANSEPIHLACEGAMRANEPRHERLDEKYLMSLVIDLSARTVKPEGHPSAPIKASVDDEDVVAFASPRAGCTRARR
jgi:hypothetical protein